MYKRETFSFIWPSEEITQKTEKAHNEDIYDRDNCPNADYWLSAFDSKEMRQDIFNLRYL